MNRIRSHWCYSFLAIVPCIASAALGCAAADEDEEQVRGDESSVTTDGVPKNCTIKNAKTATKKNLADLLENAKAGDVIYLPDGTYKGNLEASASGAKDNPITLCGSKMAKLSGTGYGLHVTGSHWKLIGFTIAEAQKGLVLDGAQDVEANDLTVEHIGMEGVHFRNGSSNNTLKNSTIRFTGEQENKKGEKTALGEGEGVYIGTAKSNQDGVLDTSDNNTVENNTIGPGVTAEAIDIKEGTTGGTIKNNHFKGGLSGVNDADSWVDVKGNGYKIEGNVGDKDGDTNNLKNGFEVHQLLPGWGLNNTFSGNRSEVKIPGYGIFIPKKEMKNTVECNNMTGEKGVTNSRKCP